MQRIAIYDLDKTITRKATLLPFLCYAVPRHQPWRVLLSPLLLLASLGYVLKLVDRGRLKEISLSLMLGRRIERAKLDELAQGFARITLSNNILQGALDQIAQDKNGGARIVIASASCRIYVAEIGKTIGVTDVVGTELVADGPEIFFKIDGENCYGDAKLRMVETWIANEGIDRTDAHIAFYSDHVSDAPCMEWADRAVATNAHPPLLALARARGWTCYDWRDPPRRSRESGNPALPQ
jgi:HAD superfamily hydrolase (TIGR01490 family)